MAHLLRRALAVVGRLCHAPAELNDDAKLVRSHMRFMRKCAPAFISEGSWDVMSIIWVRNYVLSMCMSSFQIQISLMTKHHNLMTEHYQFQSKSSETLGIGLWHCHCHQLLFAKPCCNELLLLHYVFIFLGFVCRVWSKVPKQTKVT